MFIVFVLGGNLSTGRIPVKFCRVKMEEYISLLKIFLSHLLLIPLSYAGECSSLIEARENG
jgi:hypothetical protein